MIVPAWHLPGSGVCWATTNSIHQRRYAAFPNRKSDRMSRSGTHFMIAHAARDVTPLSPNHDPDRTLEVVASVLKSIFAVGRASTRCVADNELTHCLVTRLLQRSGGQANTYVSFVGWCWQTA